MTSYSQNKVGITIFTLSFQARKILQETTIGRVDSRFMPNVSTRPMEEKSKKSQHRSSIANVTAAGDSQVAVLDVGFAESTRDQTGYSIHPPRLPSKRDSGYHTDCSPALTSPSTPQFSFDPAEAQQIAMGGTSPETGQRQPAPSALKLDCHPKHFVSDDDNDDDSAFILDTVPVEQRAAVSRPRPPKNLDAVSVPVRQSRGSRDEGERDGQNDSRLSSTRLLSVEEESEDKKEEVNKTMKFPLPLPPSRAAPATRIITSFPPNVTSLPPTNVCVSETADADDVDGDENGTQFGTTGESVSHINYHHVDLSWLPLPEGQRIRPLIRTIGTQTPRDHCQIIDQILDCPRGIPDCARGSVVRRLRYYSEGEETVRLPIHSHEPLPDLVPVTFPTRERSLSASDLEGLQRQRLVEREVGQELRRISDEFLQAHIARGQPGPLAAIHAELNGVAAFLLGGARRVLYRNFAGYFRVVFNWTRRTLQRRNGPTVLDSDTSAYR